MAVTVAEPVDGRHGRRVSPLAVGTLALAASLSPTRLAAEEELGGARLQVQIADGVTGCPTEAELAARVRTEAERSPSERLQLELLVSIFPEQTGLVGRIVVAGGRQGQRELHAASCGGLADALAVSLGILLDEELRAARAGMAPSAAEGDPLAPPDLATETGSLPEPPAEPASTAEEPTSRAALVAESPSPRRTSQPFRHTGQSVTARAVVSAGISTELTEALLGGLEVAGAHLAVRALAAWRLPRDVELAPGRLSSRWVGGLAAGCGVFGQRWRKVGCVQGWAGALHVEAAGFTADGAHDRLWTALGPSAGIETGDRATVGADLLFLVPVNRDRFHVVNVGSWEAGRPVAWLLVHGGMGFR